jgi:hypothetical protein
MFPPALKRSPDVALAGSFALKRDRFLDNVAMMVIPVTTALYVVGRRSYKM